MNLSKPLSGRRKGGRKGGSRKEGKICLTGFWKFLSWKSVFGGFALLALCVQVVLLPPALGGRFQPGEGFLSVHRSVEQRRIRSDVDRSEKRI